MRKDGASGCITKIGVLRLGIGAAEVNRGRVSTVPVLEVVRRCGVRRFMPAAMGYEGVSGVFVGSSYRGGRDRSIRWF